MAAAAAGDPGEQQTTPQSKSPEQTRQRSGKQRGEQQRQLIGMSWSRSRPTLS